jgi:hypothetical protein
VSDLGLQRPLSVPVSAGELLDKISILEIKTQRIRDPLKRRLAGEELAQLTEIASAGLANTEQVQSHRAQLRAVNEALWTIEEQIRAKEKASAFDSEFIELARSVYLTNDRRAEIKRELNDMLGSAIIEVKDYGSSTDT